MSKKIQLTIAEPCHENWENMSPVEKGKFCGSCQKQVIDFSNMSDRQVAEFFKKPSTGSVCGRFMNDQLERPMDIPQKRIPWLKYFFQILLPAFFISKASAQQKMGKVKPVHTDTTRKPIDYEFRTLGMVAPRILPVCKDTTDNRLVKGEVNTMEYKVKSIRVNGTVADEEGKPIPNVSIRVVSSGKLFMANEQGKFSTLTSKEQLLELELTSVGYAREHYIYPFTLQYSSIVDVTIQMKKSDIVLDPISCFVMGEIAINEPVKPDTATVRVDSIAKFPDRIIPDAEPSILVYPNPVKSGSTINISFNKLEEGYYQLHLLDIKGQLVLHREIWIDDEARVVSMEAPFVASGTYILVLVNKRTGKKFSQKIIIE